MEGAASNGAGMFSDGHVLLPGTATLTPGVVFSATAICAPRRRTAMFFAI